MSDVVNDIKLAKKASIDLSVLDTETKDEALAKMVEELDYGREAIIRANNMDLDAAKDMLISGEITGSMYARLKVDDSKIDDMIAGIRDVMKLKDPVGEQMSAMDLDDDLTLYQIRCPIGMIGVIFESRPDVVPQIMSLCLKSGNSVAFKGGREASNTIRVLFDMLRGAAHKAGVPEECFVLMESRDEINAILDLDEYIDLLIPRGSNQFVQYIQSHTKIPVLGHAAGIVHIYVDPTAEQSQAAKVILDSKTQYPAVCNAAETLLVDARIADEFIPKIYGVLTDAGVEVRGDEKVCRMVDCVRATDDDWYAEYDDLVIAVKVVYSLQEAVEFINSHGSHHTDAIMTTDLDNASIFVKMVDSADVFVNASTRFADGYRFGKGAEVGISTNKIHSRGPVGMEGLMIYKYVLVGDGQVVKDYVGDGCRQFKHTPSRHEYPF